jgi:hypothetical protein
VRILADWRTGARLVAPWIAAALALQLGLRLVWPHQVESARRNFSTASDLRAEAPDSQALHRRIGALASDSVLLAKRIERARHRAMAGSDPAATLAARMVPILADGGWKFQRVRAEAKDGWAILDLGAEAPFDRVLAGLRALRVGSTAVQIRRLSLRPASAGRLGIDLQIASPAVVAP